MLILEEEERVPSKREPSLSWYASQGKNDQSNLERVMAVAVEATSKNA